MIVSSISNICVTNNYDQQTNVCRFNLNEPKRMNSNDVPFTGMSRLILDKFVYKFYDPLRKFSKYSIEEYNSLSERDLSILRQRYNYLTESYRGGFYKNVEIIHDKSSEMIKASLDSKYGEGQYKVVTVGRSMSSIGKVLGYKIGEENVINIPMSSCQRYANPMYLEGLCQDNKKLEPLKTFLESVGLGKEAVINSDKKLVLMDYCCTGDSLCGTKMLFDNLYDGAENIVTENPLKLINDIELKRSLSRIFVSSSYKPYSFVNKARLLSEIPTSFVDTKMSKEEVKLVWFKLLDNEMINKKSKIEDLKTDNGNLLCLNI